MIAVFQCERSNVKIVGLQLFFVWREQFHEWVFLTNYTGTFFVNSLCMERTIVQQNCYAHKLFSRSAHTYCAHILLSRVTVGGDNHAAQRAYGSHQAGAFFFILIRSLSSLVTSNSLLLSRLDCCDSGWWGWLLGISHWLILYVGSSNTDWSLVEILKLNFDQLIIWLKSIYFGESIRPSLCLWPFFLAFSSYMAWTLSIGQLETCIYQ